jgi:nicotinamidase-related amidase
MYNTNNKKNFKSNSNQKKSKSNDKKIKDEDMITIICVDDQNDFAKPDGALYVPGGENIDAAIIDYVTKNKDLIKSFIFTRDWHLKKDESFKTNGGEWPVHCVQGTEGAEISKNLIDTIIKLGIPYIIVNKGTVPDHEEYGAFEHCATFHHLHPNDPPHVKNCYFANCESSSGCRITTENITICGIAGDYCVKETMKNLIKHWRNFKISVLMNGVASIDGGTALNEFINEYKLKTV